MRSTALLLTLAAASAAADTEIHRCVLADGTIAFQELPCAEPSAEADDSSEPVESRNAGEDPAAGDDAFDFVNPFDQPESSPPATEPAATGPVSQNRAECEKTTRDAIDAIDLEMRETEYTKEESRQYLAELLVLTEQLRRCRAL